MKWILSFFEEKGETIWGGHAGEKEHEDNVAVEDGLCFVVGVYEAFFTLFDWTIYETVCTGKDTMDFIWLLRSSLILLLITKLFLYSRVLLKSVMRVMLGLKDWINLA